MLIIKVVTTLVKGVCVSTKFMFQRYFNSKCETSLGIWCRGQLEIPDHVVVACRKSERMLKETGLDITALILSECTLAGPVYTGMSLECHWLTQCTLGYHWVTHRICAGYTGTPLEKLSWNSPTLECHWRNSNFCSLHWNTTGGTVTAHTRPDTFS